MSAAAALTLAAVFGLAWLAEPRNLCRLTVFLLGIAAACCVRCNIGLLHATTAAQYAAWIRWYHLPLFFVIAGYLLTVRFYLGTGRWWLLWTILGARAVLVVCNFLVRPNVNWLQLSNLRQVSLLGERVSVAGDLVLRKWQWLALASLLAMMVFVADACIQRWRQRGGSPRREVLVVVTGIAMPVAGAAVTGQLAMLGIVHIPVVSEPWFVFTLAAMAFELSREITSSDRRQRELTKLQGELTQVGRVTALGQLASALVHELAQPLTAIGMSASAAHMHLQKENPTLSELRSIVTDIADDDRRAGEVLDRMRSLIRRRRIELQPLVLDEVVQSVVSLVHAEAASRHVALECIMQPGLPRVLGDRVHVSQVLLNLIINGMDAVQACPIDARRVVIESRADQVMGGVETSVQDCGPGIPDASIDKVFEPFFTTKPDGMGMGLTISRTIVQTLGGRLWAEHGTAGRGATFRFTLPPA